MERWSYGELETEGSRGGGGEGGRGATMVPLSGVNESFGGGRRFNDPFEAIMKPGLVGEVRVSQDLDVILVATW